MGEVVDYFEEEFGLEADMISCGVTLIYSTLVAPKLLQVSIRINYYLNNHDMLCYTICLFIFPLFLLLFHTLLFIDEARDDGKGSG